MSPLHKTQSSVTVIDWRSLVGEGKKVIIYCKTLRNNRGSEREREREREGGRERGERES